MDLHCRFEVQKVVVEDLANVIWEEDPDFLLSLKNGDAVDYPEHADYVQYHGQLFELFEEYLEGFQA